MRLERGAGALTSLLLALALSGCGSGAAAAPDVQGVPSQARHSQAEEIFQLGQLAFERGDSVRAEQYLSLALEEGYEPRQIVPLLLSICLSNSRLRSALNHAEPFLLGNPDDDRLRYLVATIHVSLGQEEAAWAELAHLTHRNPRYADAHYLMGILELPVEPEAAREHFRDYLDLAPRGDHAAEVRSRLSQLASRGTVRSRRHVDSPIPVAANVGAGEEKAKP